jgi:hypothetical protein
LFWFFGCRGKEKFRDKKVRKKKFENDLIFILIFVSLLSDKSARLLRKRRSPKRRSPKRKSPKRKSPKRKSPKRKSPKNV